MGLIWEGIGGTILLSPRDNPMNLLQIYHRFPDQEACFEHLENVRFGHQEYCPLCGGVNVARKCDSDRVGRWNCHDCKSSFNVLSGTVMEKTRIPLQKWFLAIGLMVNAKKSLSSPQLARDLELNQKTAWYMQQRIRAAMASKQSGIKLQGIIKADETYVGGIPRKGNKKKVKNNKDLPPPSAPRGRTTRKTPVIGAVERGGKVVAQVAKDLTGRGILQFIKGTVEPTGSLLITDEYRTYNAVRGIINHATIASAMWTVIPIPTPSKGYGHFSSELGTTPITNTASPTCRCMCPKRRGSTTTGSTITPLALSSVGASA